MQTDVRKERLGDGGGLESADGQAPCCPFPSKYTGTVTPSTFLTQLQFTQTPIKGVISVCIRNVHHCQNLLFFAHRNRGNIHRIDRNPLDILSTCKNYRCAHPVYSSHLRTEKRVRNSNAPAGHTLDRIGGDTHIAEILTFVSLRACP